MTEDLNDRLAKFGMHLEFWPIDQLIKLAEKTKNPKKHYNKDIEALSQSMADLGFKSAVFIDRDATEIGAGIGRIYAAARRKDYSELPVFRILDLNKTQFKKFRIVDNRLPQLTDKWDEDLLFADLSEIAKGGGSFSYLDFPKYDRLISADDFAQFELEVPKEDAGSSPLGSLPPQFGDKEPIATDLPQTSTPNSPQVPTAPNRDDVDDSQFEVDYPSSNQFDIPDLILRYQATSLIAPVVKWGEISAKKPMNGTWTFYVDDDKFRHLVDNPLSPLMSTPTNLVELNFSTAPASRVALVIADIFFKRWVSRFWQSKGFNILVDLNVDPKFSELNLMGVPKGWTAYATRGSGPIDYVKHDWEIACRHSEASEESILFLVYGGGKATQELAQNNGWNWIPERMQIVSGNAPPLDGLPVSVLDHKWR